jgi:hypothetical protein
LLFLQDLVLHRGLTPRLQKLQVKQYYERKIANTPQIIERIRCPLDMA